MNQDINDLLDQGKRMSQDRKLEEAANVFSKIIEVDPNCISGHNHLAEIYEKKKEFSKAIYHYDSVIQKEPDNSIVLAKLARLMMWQGKCQEAISTYKKALEQGAKQPKWLRLMIFSGLGKAFKKNYQIDDSILSYQKAVELSRDNTDLYLNLAELYYEKGQWNCAINNYQKAINLQPQQPESIYIKIKDAIKKYVQIDETLNDSSFTISSNNNIYILMGEGGTKTILGKLLSSFFDIQQFDTNHTKKKYFYFLNVNYPSSQILDLEGLSNRITSKIKKLLTEENCYLVLDAANEGHKFRDKFGKGFHDIARVLKCKTQQIIYLTQNKLYLQFYNNWYKKNNLPCENRIKIWTLNSALLDIARKNHGKYYLDNFKCINQKYREKKFLFLNNLPKAHRVFLLHKIIENNLLQEGLVSFNHKIRDYNEKSEQYSSRSIKNTFFPSMDENHVDKICQDIDSHYLPLRLDLVDRANLNSHGRGKYVRDIPLELYNKTYFSIVSESDMDLGAQIKRFTEKSLKPFLGLHPFIIAGQPGTLKLLQDIGFKTFNGYIDESYDLVEDPYERANLITEQLKNLCSMSQEELHNWYTELSPILLFNYGHFVNRMPVWCKRDLLQKLELTLIS